MKCWPLDLRHMQRDSGFSAGFGRNGDPAYTLTSAQTGGGNIPAVAVAVEDAMKVWPINVRNTARNNGNPAGGLGIGKENGPHFTMIADGGHPPSVAMVEDEEQMEESKYVVRRITPTEAERLQGFPEVICLNTDIINRDEAVVFALVNGDIFTEPDTGQIFRTRGSGGIRLNTPIEIIGSNCNGYKVFSLHAKGKKWQIKKHRAIWISVNGIPSDGMVVDHINNDKTDNRIANLQLLTPEDNSTKASIDGCYLCGDDNPQTKLPVEMRDVVYKEYLSGAGTYRQLAEKYGVSKSRIAQIVQSKGYTDVEFKGKPAPDTARYKALGNSMTVNVMQWIAKRILMVEKGEL